MTRSSLIDRLWIAAAIVESGSDGSWRILCQSSYWVWLIIGQSFIFIIQFGVAIFLQKTSDIIVGSEGDCVVAFTF